MTLPPATPPGPVRRSFQLWIAAVVVGLLGGVLPLATPTGSAAGGVVGAVIGLLFLAALVVLALQMRRGANWARWALSVLGGLSAVFTVVGVLLTAGLGVSLGWLSTVLGLVQAGLIVAAILLAHQAPASAYFR